MNKKDKDGSKSDLTDDQKIGIRIRDLRQQMNMTQKNLGEALGVTFQQVQKYERGANRVDPTKIVKMSNLFGVNPAYFFSNDAELELPNTKIEKEVWDFIHSRQGKALNKSFKRIKSKELRNTVLHFIIGTAKYQDK